MRHPPAAVPAAIVAAHKTFTHAGTFPKTGVCKNCSHSGRLSKLPAFVPVNKRERNNAHRFLRVVRAVTVRHPGSAENLEPSENGIHRSRPKTVQQNEKQKHDQRAENKTGNRRGEHRQHHLWPKTGVPFQHRPLPMCAGDRCTTKSADERVTGTRRQSRPTRSQYSRQTQR